jgi:hypothetical protein
VVADLPPPGILTNQPLSDKSPEMRLLQKGNPDELAAFTREIGASGFEIQSNWDWVAFNQLLAKIAHSYATAMVGLVGFEPYLPPLILGTAYYFSHYIGGIENPADAVVPPQDLSLGWKTIAAGVMLVARTTIFGGNRFPTYEVVVGRITDFDLIRTKSDCAALR